MTLLFENASIIDSSRHCPPGLFCWRDSLRYIIVSKPLRSLPRITVFQRQAPRSPQIFFTTDQRCAMYIMYIFCWGLLQGVTSIQLWFRSRDVLRHDNIEKPTLILFSRLQSIGCIRLGSSFFSKIFLSNKERASDVCCACSFLRRREGGNKDVRPNLRCRSRLWPTERVQHPLGLLLRQRL